MGHSLVCSISSLRNLGVARFKLTLEVALTANSKVKGAREPDLLYFVKLMIIVLNCQHKNPMNASTVKIIACNHGLPQIFQKVYLASSSRKENEGALKSQNCLNRLWGRHVTSFPGIPTLKPLVVWVSDHYLSLFRSLAHLLLLVILSSINNNIDRKTIHPFIYLQL